MKVKGGVALICLVFNGLSNKAQTNLVSNPSFENVTCCPTQCNALINNCVIGWSNPTGNSPDYFNSCSVTSCRTPSNSYGYQTPRTGGAYAGIYIYLATNQKEYVQNKLADSLFPGIRYCVEFYVSPVEFYYNVSSCLEVYLTDTLTQITSVSFINAMPQIQNPFSNIISDTSNWIKVSGSFIALGGEKYITIGCFKPDNQMNIDSVPWGGSYPVYYYIDDVSVYRCDTIPPPVPIPSTVLYPSPNNGEFTLQYYLQPESGGDIEIYNMLGQIIYRKELDYTKYVENFVLPQLPGGVYWVSVKENDNEIYTTKFCVVK